MERSNLAVASAIPARALDAFNWIRGVAAILVLMGHIRALFFFVRRWVRFSPSFRAFHFVTGFSHQAVIVFFVLSGFFIGTSVVVTSRDGTWSWQRFLTRRLTRLYVVLLPTLLLTAAWDNLGRSIFGNIGNYRDSVVAFTLPVFLGNVAFLQGVVTLSFGTNGPLWTLACEFWAYLLFPLLFRAAVGNERAAVKAIYALLAVAILGVGGALLRLSFAVWAMGAAVAIGWVRYRRVFTFHRITTLGMAGAFLAALALSRFKLLRWGPAQDLVLGLGTALFVAMLLGSGRARAKSDSPISRAYRSAGETMAGFSYTLYAIQFPVLAFLRAWLVGKRRWSPDLPHEAAAILLGLLVIGLYAYPLARLTEGRTEDVRRWLERRLGLGTRPPSGAV